MSFETLQAIQSCPYIGNIAGASAPEKLLAMQDIDSLKQSLQALRKKFGAGYVGSHLMPCISEIEVRDFEERHSILLPPEYRYFLTIVGNGCDELFKLGEMDDGHSFRRWAENDGFVGTLGKPFNYTEAFNDLSGQPLYEEGRENDPDWLDDYDRKRQIFDEQYFRPLDGAFPISQLGCAIREWLVVTGSERGNVWYDDRANLEGIRPHRGSSGGRLSFLEWCKGWPNG